MKTLQRIAICLILGVMLVVALPTQASPWIYVYPLPGYGNITDFTVDRNGSAWVVDNANHAIYEVMFGKYGQYTYNFRQPNSHWPLGITEGPGGIMWFTDEIANQIILISQYGGTNAYSLGQTCSPK